MRKNQVQFLGQKDPLEKEMAKHSSILAWRIPWTEEPVQSVAKNWTQLKKLSSSINIYIVPDHRPASWETYMQVRKQQLELDMEQQTGSK